MQRLGRLAEWLLLLVIYVCCQPLEAQVLPPNTPVTINKSLPADRKDQYVVQPGDTYYRLSRIYRVPVDSLIKWNGERLPVGKTIRVMAGDFPPAPHLPVTGAREAPAPAADSSKSAVIVTEQPGVEFEKPASTTMTRYEESERPVVAKNEAQRVMVIPFDPYLYFSDADNDISRQSRIPSQNVRYVFRSRLNAFLDPKGFQSINLLGGVRRDSIDELSKIYKSLAYSYQDITWSRFNPLPANQKPLATGPKAWFKRQKEKIGITPPVEEVIAGEGKKYYGVKVKNPDFYTYFNTHYNVDYYLFINQFEIHTDYTNCIDRVTQNFVREFLVHYTIFDAKGELIAGNKVKIPYVSNVNDLEKIVRDNLNKMAQRILSDLPQPQYFTSGPQAAQK